MCIKLSMYSCNELIFYSVVTIGFNGTYYVREDTARISVVLVLMNSLARNVVVTLSTLDDTAIGRFVKCLFYKITMTTYLYLPVCS